MILKSLFGLSLVLTVSLDTPAPDFPDPTTWLQLSVRQKDAVLLPLMRRATDCVVRSVTGYPRYSADMRPGDINNVIVDFDFSLRAPGARDERRS